MTMRFHDRQALLNAGRERRLESRRINAGAFALLLGAALAGAFCAGCSKGGGDESADKPEAAITQVTLTQVTRADVSRVLQLTGSVAPLLNRDVKVSALVPGRVTQLDVAEGDSVAAGQVLAKLDDNTYRDQVTQAEAAAAQAQANVENAKLNLARDEDLVQRGIAARKELEDARTEESVAEAAVRQAAAALSVARLQLSRTSIPSPIAGAVVKRFVSQGEQVDGTAATPIVEVASLGEAELMANIPVADLANLKPGREVKLTSESLPGRVYSGKVIAVSQAVDPVSNSGLVRIRARNVGGALRIGMFLAAQVPIETHLKALTVPPQAIYLDQDGQPRVFVVQGDTVAATPVKLGIQTTDLTELLSGVKEGDKVVLTGGYGLSDKAKISVQGQQDQSGQQDKPAQKPGSAKP